jgi:hypothetical protein
MVKHCEKLNNEVVRDLVHQRVDELEHSGEM